MPFTPSDFQAFIQMLREHPALREELRQFLIAEGLLDLPDIVRQLSEAQHRTQQRVEALVEAQRHLEQRFEALEKAHLRLERRLKELAEAQQYNAQQVEALAAAHAQISKALKALKRLLHRSGETAHYAPGEVLLLAPDGEADIVLPVKAPDGQTAWLVVESRARHSWLEVTNWSLDNRLDD